MQNYHFWIKIQLAKGLKKNGKKICVFMVISAPIESFTELYRVWYSAGTQFIKLVMLRKITSIHVILRKITQNYVIFCKNQNGRFFIIFEGNYVKFRDFRLLKKLKNKKISLKKIIKKLRNLVKNLEV